MPGARWFEGAELNYAENLLDGRARMPDSSVAVLHTSELRELGALTWGELSAEVAVAAAALRELGVAARRPRGRIHAEHPRDARRVPGRRQHRRDLVERRSRSSARAA